MGKIVGWVIAIGLIAVLAYALISGLPADVVSPFRPPNP